MNLDVQDVFDESSDVFRAEQVAFDVVCAGDSLTGWCNVGPAESWPYPCYPEFLQALCEPLGLKVANCGLAGEISDEGVRQVRDYLKLFTTAKFFPLCYGANDLDDSDDHEATSSRILANLGHMVQFVWKRGRQPIVLDIPDVNGRLFPADMLQAARAARSYHNARLKQFCQDLDIPLAVISGCLGDGHFGDACHPNAEGARIIAGSVFDVLIRCAG